VKQQNGLATVEFAAVAAAFMIITLGALELSRALYTWNTLDAIVQRAARMAAVCPMNHANIESIAMFGQAGDATGIIPDFTANNLSIEYLGGAYQTVNTVPATEFVRASIVNYQIDLAIPFISNSTFTSPNFSATIPAESLGWTPGNFGAAGTYTC